MYDRFVDPAPAISPPTVPVADGARPGLSGLAPGELEAWLVVRGHPTYRARQVGDAVWGGHATTAHELRGLPQALRAEIEREFRVDTLAGTEVSIADGGLT